MIDSPGQKIAILVVDDDRGLAANLSDILEGEGYAPSVAANGGEALALAKERVFDLAIVDVKLPDMPGTRLIERLVSLSPSIESVLITGFASLESAMEAIRQKNIVGYEIKPVDIDRLIALLRKVCEKRRLEREILNISERERRSIGQELHDGLGQHLTGIALHARVLEQALKNRNLPEAEQADRISELARQAIAEAGRLARGLAPISIETKGLRTALEELLESVGRAGGVKFRFFWDVQVPEPEKDAAIHLYRIAQEALNNAIKHAQPRALEIRVELKNNDMVVTVSDDGSGIPEKPDSSGMGLNLMRHRASTIRCALDIAPRRGGGTEVIVRCPRRLSEREERS